MSGIKYYILDVETTGLKANHNEVNEIGIIRFDDKLHLWKKVKCKFPERASLDALAVTKKTLDDLKVGEESKDVVNQCNKMFELDGAKPSQRCIVAHNGKFDRKFVHAMWEEAGQRFPADLWIDTIDLTNEFIKTADVSTLKVNRTPTGRISMKLQPCCDMVGIKKFADAHNASVDCKNTYLLFKNLMVDRVLPFFKHIKTEPHAYNIVEDYSMDFEEDQFDENLLDD